MPPKTDDFLCALGAVTLRFSELEELLMEHTAKLIDQHDHGVGIATLASLDFRKITLIFETLVLERTSWRYTIVVGGVPYANAKEIHDRLKPLIKKLDDVREQRNQVIHAHWSPRYRLDATSGDFVQAAGIAEHTTHKKKLHEGYIRKTTTWTVAELGAVAAGIEGAARELDEFVTWANTLTPLFPEEE
jgi:hypothetical protein